MFLFFRVDYLLGCSKSSDVKIKTSFLALATLLFLVASAPAQEMRDEVSYSNDIKPLVENFCTTCHAGDDPEGDMVLTS